MSERRIAHSPTKSRRSHSSSTMTSADAGTARISARGRGSGALDGCMGRTVRFNQMAKPFGSRLIWPSHYSHVVVTLAERIRARRLAVGLSQNELARRADVNAPTLFKIESGQRRDPSVSVIVRIARALGTTAETLLGLDAAGAQDTPVKESGSKKRRATLDAERLASGSIALVEEIAALRRRVDALEAWRRSQEGRPR